MLPKEIHARQRDLTGYIKELAKISIEESDVDVWINRFELIYGDNFRHNYSDFFPILQDIYDESSDSGNSEFLSNNIEMIRNKIEKRIESGESTNQGLYNKFTRLSEHINLQISQLNYFKAQEAKLNSITYNQAEQEGIKNAWKEVRKNIGDNMKMMEEKIDAANNQANSMITQVVTILGIFAAIVLAFSGGISILGNAIMALTSAEIVVYKVAFICLMTGFLLFNLIFMLMYFIGKITDKSIYAECGAKDCTCGKDGKAKCKGITRVRRRLPYVFYFNITVVLLMVADVTIWELIKNNFVH